MSSSAHHLAIGRDVLSQEASALLAASFSLDTEFTKAVDLILNCQGRLIVTGIGKSGHIGSKLAATFASTGTPAYFVHAAEAAHGDLGMITPDDVVIAISYSGESSELAVIIPMLVRSGVKIIAMTGKPQSTLGAGADAVINCHVQREACPNNLAPTTSTTLTMAIGDALAIAMIHQRKFMPNDFARYHPGGSLGRRLLTRVADVMLHDVPAVQLDASFKTVIQRITSGCQGMVMVEDAEGGLAGIITDGDLRRFMEKEDSLTSATAAQMMTREPLTLPEDTMIIEAEEKMQKHRVSTLLVTNKANKVTGLVRIFD